LVAVRFTGFVVAVRAFVAATCTLSVVLAFDGHEHAPPKASAVWNIGVIT
jgi:hypothetical protein